MDSPDDEVWIVWSQDTFGFGEDRDPPLVESVHPCEADAAAALESLKQQESRNAFIRFWLQKTRRSALPPRERWLQR
jgi:hypothetical protein